MTELEDKVRVEVGKVQDPETGQKLRQEKLPLNLFRQVHSAQLPSSFQLTSGMRPSRFQA